MKRIGLVTCKSRAHEALEDPLLVEAFKSRGYDCDRPIWDDTSVTWSDYDALIIRSTWDYQYRLDEFPSWVAEIEKNNVQLFNPPSVLRWNCRKFYLRQLQSKGVLIPDTVWIEANQSFDLAKIMDEKGWSKCVVKPVLGAGAQNTFLVSRSEADHHLSMNDEHLRIHGTLIQEFLPEITETGEWSFLYFGGEFSHAVIKTPKSGDFRVQHYYGGTYAPGVPTETTLRQTKAILDLAPAKLLYARVDGIVRDGNFILIELEVFEPWTFFAFKAQSELAFVDAFAETIADTDSNQHTIELNPLPTNPPLPELTPAQIVSELDNYIIGQVDAKRAVAIALRNRWRRQKVKGDIRDEIYPNNILLIGPTGVGKTELARRLANLAGAPFIKVEASKYTEVGYVGRDVESMVRDLMDAAVAKVRKEYMDQLRERLDSTIEERLLDLMLPPPPIADSPDANRELRKAKQERYRADRHDLRKKLRDGELEDESVEIDVSESVMPMMQIFSAQGIKKMGFHMPEAIGEGEIKKRRRSATISEAREILSEEEFEKQIDNDRVVREAHRRAESLGIIFLDEIDKIVASGDATEGGPDVSRSGVQRDILPVVEGTTVTTKYGLLKSDHILFIAAGAFSAVKPSDLIPELQGRFPIRVEMDKLGADEFLRILTEPKNALIKQYIALLETEGIDLSFTRDALREIADTAHEVNERTEDIGARRLHTILTTLLEDILFDAPTMTTKQVRITQTKVRSVLKDIVEDEDLSRFIL